MAPKLIFINFWWVCLVLVSDNLSLCDGDSGMSTWFEVVWRWNCVYWYWICRWIEMDVVIEERIFHHSNKVVERRDWLSRVYHVYSLKSGIQTGQNLGQQNTEDVWNIRPHWLDGDPLHYYEESTILSTVIISQPLLIFKLCLCSFNRQGIHLNWVNKLSLSNSSLWFTHFEQWDTSSQECGSAMDWNRCLEKQSNPVEVESGCD